MTSSEYDSILSKANISGSEKAKILQNLEKAESSGLSRTQMRDLVNRIVSRTDFRRLFISDLRGALKQFQGPTQDAP